MPGGRSTEIRDFLIRLLPDRRREFGERRQLFMQAPPLPAVLYTMSTPAPASVLAPKPHYAALDGLRGVAAVMVVLFHMFEGSARDFQFHMDQIINHGYLSVDFFFMLSGFVIGYAYDDRWEKK